MGYIMIEETIHSILEAEDKAAELRKTSKDEVKALYEQAERQEAEAQKTLSAECRALLAAARERGEAAGEEAYAAILADGEAQAEALRSSASKREAAVVQKIVEEILR